MKKRDARKQSSVISGQSSVISEQSSVISGQSSVISKPPSGTSQSSVKEALYTMRIWRGKTQYVCPLCGADTFDKKIMLKHLVNKHDSELALVELVRLENKTPSQPPPNAESANLGEGNQEDVFEVELVETGSTVDAQGNEHKTFTIKE
jgi:hypothetical protein